MAGGFDVPAEVSVAHHDFDGHPLRKGGARQGVLLFEMREDAGVQALVWQDELAWERADVAAGAYADADAA